MHWRLKEPGHIMVCPEYSGLGTRRTRKWFILCTYIFLKQYCNVKSSIFVWTDFFVIYMQYPMQFPDHSFQIYCCISPDLYLVIRHPQWRQDMSLTFFSSDLPFALWIQIVWRFFSVSRCPQSDHMTLSIVVHWQWMHAFKVHTGKKYLNEMLQPSFKNFKELSKVTYWIKAKHHGSPVWVSRLPLGCQGAGADLWSTLQPRRLSNSVGSVHTQTQ